MISRFFIDRPIFATVLSVVIMLIGGISLIYLPVAQYPRITPPGVNISISYPGASAQVVADTVGAPIEQEVNGVEGMLYMSSNSGNDGTYSLSVTFDVGTDLNTAVVKVQNRVALAMPQLPSQVQNQGITIRKKTPDILMIVNFYSPKGKFDDIYLSNYATINVRDELLRVPGVSDITYQGERDYSIRCWLDPQKMAACGITAVDVSNAVKNQNLDAPAGWVGAPPTDRYQAFEMPINTLGRLDTPEQFGDIIIKASMSSPPTGARTITVAPPQGNFGSPSSSSAASSNPTSGATSDTASAAASSSAASATSGGTAGGGVTTSGGASTGGGATAGGGGSTGGGGMSGSSATSSAGGVGVSNGVTPGRGPGQPSFAAVRMRDIAHIELGAQNYNASCFFDGMPSVGLSVYQKPDTNALEVADAVRAKMEELSGRFPDDLRYAIGYDTTPFIRESVEDVALTMLEAVALVGFVVLIFLQDWKAMILPMIDVPVSIVGTFAVMALMGFSLNNISLFGLVLAVGIVVDDAIVVLENIERMLARGHDVRTATIKAMEEVTGPIIAVALVLCTVFVPCAFISGITGQFFRQFALTISVLTVISAINAITMTPSRAVLLFKTEESGARSPGFSRNPADIPAKAGTTSAAPAMPGHELRREALPWWSFCFAGGAVTVWLAQRFLAGHLGVPAAEDMSVGTWRFWLVNAAFFLPGAAAGGVLGWKSIARVNPVLGRLFRQFNHGFDRMSTGYAHSVGGLLRVTVLVLLAYCGLLALTAVVFRRALMGFIPEQDQGRLIANVQLPDSASLQRTEEVVARIEKIIHGDPQDLEQHPPMAGIAHTVTFAGISFLLQANSSNFASMFIVLDPFDKRRSPDLRADAIMERLSREIGRQERDAVFAIRGPSSIPGLGTAGGFKFEVEDRGGMGMADLQAQTERLVGQLKRQVPGLSGVSTQFRSKMPQLYLDADRDKATSLGVSVDDVNQTLNILMGSSYVNSFNAFGRHWQVTLQADGEYRNRVEDMNLFQVRNSLGQMVLLGALVRPRDMVGPISVPRYNLYSAASVGGNIRTGTSTGEAIADIDRVAGDTLPLSMSADWTELMFLQKRVGDTSIYVFFLAVVSVFLALSALYESWALPLAVILVVPLCLLCSAAGVLVTHRDVNIFVQIGLVVLVGLACKNAILVVEYAKQLHVEGRSAFEATKEASRLRLRPILMTSLAFIFGVIPLTVASGAGAEMRRSLGVAVFSGMFGVTLFGIFLTPVFFYAIIGVGESRLLASVAVRRWVSCFLGGGVGLAGGFLLGKLDVFRLPWSALVGAAAGVLAAMAAFEILRRIKDK